jgi:hypothetical protein
MKRVAIAALALATTLAVAPSGPARADGSRDRVMATIADSARAAGAKSVEWGAVGGDDARFTVADTKVSFDDDGHTSVLGIAQATYTGAAPTADGGYTADEIALDRLTLAEHDATFTVQKVVITRYVGRSPDAIRAKTTEGERFDRIAVDGMLITPTDGKPVPIASIAIAAADWTMGVPRRGSLEIKGVVIPVDAANDTTKELARLGYSRLSMDFVASGNWDDEAGRVVVDHLDLTGAEMGSLKFVLTVSGLTPAIVTELGRSDLDENRRMEILQGLVVERAGIRFEDASLTGRVLTAQAAEQGTDAKAYAKQLKLMLPMVLSMVGNKDFERRVATAAGAFLDAPKSLTVSATPKRPLPVSDIVGAATTAPQSLPDVLGADVRAND